MKKSPRVKTKIVHRKELPNNILENVKSQLQDLEEIEERIPATAHKDTYVRYPFLGPGWFKKNCCYSLNIQEVSFINLLGQLLINSN